MKSESRFVYDSQRRNSLNNPNFYPERVDLNFNFGNCANIKYPQCVLDKTVCTPCIVSILFMGNVSNHLLKINSWNVWISKETENHKQMDELFQKKKT